MRSYLPHIDEDYISFLESLKASENAEPVSLESLSSSIYALMLFRTSSNLSQLHRPNHHRPPRLLPFSRPLRPRKVLTRTRSLSFATTHTIHKFTLPARTTRRKLLQILCPPNHRKRHFPALPIYRLEVGRKARRKDLPLKQTHLPPVARKEQVPVPHLRMPQPSNLL